MAISIELTSVLRRRRALSRRALGGEAVRQQLHETWAVTLRKTSSWKALGGDGRWRELMFAVHEQSLPHFVKRKSKC
jgi:hypothetical protein